MFQTKFTRNNEQDKGGNRAAAYNDCEITIELHWLRIKPKRRSWRSPKNERTRMTLLVAIAKSQSSSKSNALLVTQTIHLLRIKRDRLVALEKKEQKTLLEYSKEGSSRCCLQLGHHNQALYWFHQLRIKRDRVVTAQGRIPNLKRPNGWKFSRLSEIAATAIFQERLWLFITNIADDTESGRP